ncbi:MAG TPA: SPFH domain-containing protein [Thermoanaerobaculia bacterium]|jgi:regulator of protease activity HflC (stomatin/prohibitin superfamily)|nr:SPFH domain-containing protein [Thermoanaerobaculia bacterium]
MGIQELPQTPKSVEGAPGGSEGGFFRRLAARFKRRRFPPSKFPFRRTLIPLAIALALLLLYRFGERSLQPVPPGSVGVSVNRFTGGLDVLPPGTHFRPGALYQIHAVRISDRLLSGPEGNFNVSTKDGVVAQVGVQARWAIDRARLLSKWAALPPDPERELVAPVIAAAFRATAPRYAVGQVVAEKREELAVVAARQARERLSESGILLKEVLIGEVVLPAEYERGRVAMVDEVQNTERMDVTLKLKAKEVERIRLEAEAVKARQIKEAEGIAAQRLIGARAEADAMKFILEQKEKEIRQKRLEAEAEKETRVQRAQAEATVTKIQAGAEADRRKTIADAEAYSIRTTTLAQFENLEREAELVSANPLLIPKTFADRLSDKVQVILTPTVGGEAFTDEVVRRAVRGEGQPVESRTRTAANRQTANKNPRTN